MPRSPEQKPFKTAEQVLLAKIFGEKSPEVERSGEPREIKQQDHRVLVDHVKNVTSTLTEREEKVLKLRFGLEDGRSRTLKEAGEAIGRSERTAGRVESSALQKLRGRSSEKKKLQDYLE
jgi:RNA polymerase primary sigma factor